MINSCIYFITYDFVYINFILKNIFLFKYYLLISEIFIYSKKKLVVYLDIFVYKNYTFAKISQTLLIMQMRYIFG